MTDLQGAPRSWDPDAHFVLVPRAAVVEVGLIDAYVFSLIRFRCVNRDRYTATVREIADEIGLSVATTRKASNRLRERGYVTATRESSYDATLTWAIRWADDGWSSRGDLSGQTSDLTGQAVCPEGSSPPSLKKVRSPNNTLVADAESALDRIIEHHADLVAKWSEKPPTISAKTRTSLSRLADKHGESEVRMVIGWAQEDRNFWRTRTETLAEVVRNWSKVRQQWRDNKPGNVHYAEDNSERVRDFDTPTVGSMGIPRRSTDGRAAQGPDWLAPEQRGSAAEAAGHETPD